MPLSRTEYRSNTKLQISAGLLCVVLFACFGVSCALLQSKGERAKLAYVSTEAGVNAEFGEPFGIAVLGSDVYVSDGEMDRIWRLTPDGPVVFSADLNTPSAIAFDVTGNLIVADTGSHTVRSIDPSGKVSVIAGITGRSGLDDGASGVAAFNGPIGVTVAKDGRIYVADTYNDRIRQIKDGVVSTIAGSSRGFADGTGGNAKFDTPTGLAMWGDKLLIADSGNGRIRVVETDGSVWTLTGSGPDELADGLLANAGLDQPSAIAVDGMDRIYFTDGNAVRCIDAAPFPSVRTLSSDRRGILDDTVHRSLFNRPSGLSVASDGTLMVADSENGLVRSITAKDTGKKIDAGTIIKLRGDPLEFRNAAPPRWPYDPPEAPRDIAGTLGEIRGEIDEDGDRARFHNGLDIAGAYGEIARFIRDEKVQRPIAAENFGTLRELLRLPQLGYIHIRLGRDQSSIPGGDSRFLFDRDQSGKLINVRVPRGAKFAAGDPIGTLNAMNHVHLVAGPSGYEMNALEALTLPGIVDRRPPTIEKVSLVDENWQGIETGNENSRIKLGRKARVVVRAFDQMDGNPERRRLGVYSVQWGLRSASPVMHAVMGEWRFDRLPPPGMVRMFYAPGSRSGSEGVTVFNYIATSSFAGENINEEFLDPEKLDNGNYTLSVQVADYFGNTATHDIHLEVIK